jgi:hypothetical protein
LVLGTSISAEDLLKLRHQLRTVVAFLTGHAAVKKHLNIVGLFDGDQDYRFCKMESETA